MTGNEISQILFSIVLSYYGGRGHRPRWIAAGVLFSALSAFVLASPHALYGPGSDALSVTEEYVRDYDPSWEPPTTTTTPFPALLPQFGVNESGAGAAAGGWAKGRVTLCKVGGSVSKRGDCEAADVSVVPLVLIFISQFIMGIGVLLFFSLGGKNKKESGIMGY